MEKSASSLNLIRSLDSWAKELPASTAMAARIVMNLLIMVDWIMLQTVG